MAKVLVTGGAGFLGSHIVNYLASKGEDVVILDNLSGGSKNNVVRTKDVKFVDGSITDTAMVNQLFKANHFNYVYHLAAYASEGLSHHIRVHNYQTNLLGSMNLINASINTGVQCFVFTSSAAVYGNPSSPASETTLPNPLDPYAIAKLAVEMDLQVAKDYHDLNYIIFRPHNLYGEWQNLHDPFRNVVAIFMRQVLEGSPITVFGDGHQQRAFSYIGDFAKLIAESPYVSDTHNEIFNIGADTSYTINELAHLIMETLQLNSSIEFVGKRLEAYQVSVDHSKLKSVFEYEVTQLSEGLHNMAKWVRQQDTVIHTKNPVIEVRKNMPRKWH